MTVSCAYEAFAAVFDKQSSQVSKEVYESETSGMVYFQKPDFWSGTQIYCHIYQADGDHTAFYGWQLKAEKCTDMGNGKWSYNLSVLDNSTQLDGGLGNGTYSLMFCDSANNETCPLMFNKNVIADTYNVVATTVENPGDFSLTQ